jgi:hypothetical protein
MSFSYLTLIYLHRMNLTDTQCNDIALTHHITTFIHNIHVLLQAWNGTVLLARFPKPSANLRYSADRFNSWIFHTMRRKEVMLTAGPTATSSVVCNVFGKQCALLERLSSTGAKSGQLLSLPQRPKWHGFNPVDLNSMCASNKVTEVYSF